MSSPAPATTIGTATPSTDPRSPRRVRHEPRRRTLSVKTSERNAAHMVRVTLGGDLDGFVSLGFDDHVKLFFPDGTRDADGTPNVLGRDFTPRHFDPLTKTLQIDFVLHDAGPATRWAAQARPGAALIVGGPRGSFIIPIAFDWHLLIGDETGLPAISRRLAELPSGARAIVVGEIDGPADELAFETQADATIVWAHRNGAAPGANDVLARTLASLTLPAGDFYAWVACESLTAKALRKQLIAECGANPNWLRAAGYWRRGAVAVHDVHDE
jgi:NADPH-dependent ferric siderophore reductase